jgi:hypothetical protein
MKKEIFCLLLFSLAACASYHKRPDRAPTHLIYSPNGEPLNGGPLGRPTCEEAMGGWFDRLADAGGNLPRAVFLADAAAQFQRMDIDHNGYLLSEELERYRQPYRQSLESEAAPRRDEDEADTKVHHGKSAHAEDREENRPYAAPDPVLSADVNNAFRVTLAAFMTQAQKNFDALDAEHREALTRADVLKACNINSP